MEEAYVEIFTSQGCVNCPAVKQWLKELSEEIDGDITVEEIDIARDSSRAAEYGIMSVPSVVVNGVLKCSGDPTKEDLRNAINEEMAG
jgi:small redox-active disulfide protein 1